MSHEASDDEWDAAGDQGPLVEMIGAGAPLSDDEEARSPGRPEPPTIDLPAAAASEPAGPEVCGVPLKWISLLALTLQTSGQSILIKWSKSGHAADEVRYLSSTAVFFTELVKAVVSFALVVVDSGGLSEAGASMKEHFTQAPVELLKAAVPSLIYTIQNNLMFYSFEKLSAPVQQVLYQMKVITTAGLGVLMLGKRLTVVQWTSCFMLASGVALVQWPRHQDATSLSTVSQGDRAKGFVAVLCACVTSGFAGVWIQKMLQQTTASIWIRNVQLGLFGLAMGLLVALFQDGQRIVEGGFIQGYNFRVVAVIAMNAFGGLLCALMLKYAGATHGCFSTAVSIVLTSFLSKAFLGDSSMDVLFFIGSAVTVGASLLFALGLPPGLVELLHKRSLALQPKSGRSPAVNGIR